MPPRKALLIVHKSTSDPGRVGRLLRERNYELDIRCPNLGAPLPSCMASHDAVVIFGGPMSANDGRDMPGIGAELDFIPVALESGKPFLGICLGAQLLAKALGARVTKHPEGLAEIGYARIAPTTEGMAFFDGPMMVYEWHREGFDLPREATLLAEGTVFPNQFFRYGDRAFGMQFHPEVTGEKIEQWTLRSAERLKLPGAQPREAHLSGFAQYDGTINRWIQCFMDRLFGSVPDENEQLEGAALSPTSA